MAEKGGLFRFLWQPEALFLSLSLGRAREIESESESERKKIMIRRLEHHAATSAGSGAARASHLAAARGSSPSRQVSGRGQLSS